MAAALDGRDIMKVKGSNRTFRRDRSDGLSATRCDTSFFFTPPPSCGHPSSPSGVPPASPTVDPRVSSCQQILPYGRGIAC